MTNDALYNKEAALEDRMKAIKKTPVGELLGMIMGLEAVIIALQNEVITLNRGRGRINK